MIDRSKVANSVVSMSVYQLEFVEKERKVVVVVLFCIFAKILHRRNSIFLVSVSSAFINSFLEKDESRNN